MKFPFDSIIPESPGRLKGNAPVPEKYDGPDPVPGPSIRTGPHISGRSIERIERMNLF